MINKKELNGILLRNSYILTKIKETIDKKNETEAEWDFVSINEEDLDWLRPENKVFFIDLGAQTLEYFPDGFDVEVGFSFKRGNLYVAETLDDLRKLYPALKEMQSIPYWYGFYCDKNNFPTNELGVNIQVALNKYNEIIAKYK